MWRTGPFEIGFKCQFRFAIFCERQVSTNSTVDYKNTSPHLDGVASPAGARLHGLVAIAPGHGQGALGNRYTGPVKKSCKYGKTMVSASPF